MAETFFYNHSTEKIKPVLRWAGGKSKLLPAINNLLPKKWNKYLEPMLGSGALFFYLNPKTSILSDSNPDLINFYLMLKKYPERLITELMKLKATDYKYYEMRKSRPRDPLKKAIRFAYLNRLSWNGLFRVNKNGEFNVPIGDRLPKILWNPDHLWAASGKLQNATMHVSDFGEVLNLASKGDFVYLDPPYPRGSSIRIGFNRYSPNKFAIEDHARLAKYLSVISTKGIKIMITLANVDYILSAYPQDFNINVIESNALLSSKSDSRGPVQEVVMRNYDY